MLDKLFKIGIGLLIISFFIIGGLILFLLCFNASGYFLLFVITPIVLYTSYWIGSKFLEKKGIFDLKGLFYNVD